MRNKTEVLTFPDMMVEGMSKDHHEREEKERGMVEGGWGGSVTRPHIQLNYKEAGVCAC